MRSITSLTVNVSPNVCVAAKTKPRRFAVLHHHSHDHQPQHPPPQRPGHRDALDKNEFFLYCKRTGQLYLFFQLYPGG